jgi:hypothetical protein
MAAFRRTTMKGLIILPEEKSKLRRNRGMSHHEDRRHPNFPVVASVKLNKVFFPETPSVYL